jgi:hypothetical protein
MLGGGNGSGCTATGSVPISAWVCGDTAVRIVVEAQAGALVAAIC